MKKVAILVTHSYYDEDSKNIYKDMVRAQVSQLQSAMKEINLDLSPAYWEDYGNDWGKFDLVLPLMAWDYPSNTARFLNALSEIEKCGTKVLNPPHILRDNMNKSYLGRLYEKGAKVPPTIEIDGQNYEEINSAFERLNCDEIIVKPIIGAGAWRQARIKRGQDLPTLENLPPGRALVQPFIEGVAKSGELSMLFMGGELSHALMKTPKEGDYRTQPKYGAKEFNVKPPEKALDAAKSILANYDPDNELLYARIDMVEHENDWLLMEMELIEPYLYGPYDGQSGKLSAMNFARATRVRLELG